MDSKTGSTSEPDQQVEVMTAKESGESAAVATNLGCASVASLIETLGLADQDEVSLQHLLKALQAQVMSSLEELTTITTHDDNLERQYKEVVAENTKLQTELEKARYEIRHLRGQLSIIQMSSFEVREEKARTQLRERKRLEHEKLIEMQRAQGHLSDGGIYVPSVADRARTVNSKGQYVDHRLIRSHARSSTYPASQPLPSLSPTNKTSPQGRHTEPLPPPLVGCGCSECNSRQTLGALTLSGRHLCQGHLTNQLTKSGQQILLGDKVVVKGERLGHVCYIGKLDFDFFDQIYIGIHLDMPVGNSNGTLKGRRYFQCPPSHGVFVKPADVICVTGRKPLSGGTAVPRVREKVPLALLKDSNKQLPREQSSSMLTQQSSIAPSSHSTSTIMRAKAITQSELSALKQKDPYELVDISVKEMTERMKALAQKQRSHDQIREPPSPSVATPTDEPDGGTPQGIPPQPLPPIAEHATSPTPKMPTPGPTPPGSTPRPATPLEKTLLELLSDADLGATGFLKVNELQAVLLKLGKISPEGVTDLLTQVGVDVEDEAVGLPYHTLLPHLLSPLERALLVT